MYLENIYEGHSIDKGDSKRNCFSEIFSMNVNYVLFWINLNQKLFQYPKNISFEAIQDVKKIQVLPV